MMTQQRHNNVLTTLQQRHDDVATEPQHSRNNVAAPSLHLFHFMQTYFALLSPRTRACALQRV